MDDSALNAPPPARPGEPSGLRRPRSRTARTGAALVLAATLVWPATGAQALTAPEPPVAVDEGPAVEPSVTPAAPAPAPADEATAADPQATPSTAPAATDGAPASGPQATQSPAPAAPEVPAATTAPSPAAPASPAGAAAAAADPEPTSTLSGRVTAGTGAPLEAVLVQVLGLGTRSTVTAADGTWTLDDVAPGPHVLRFLPDGADAETSTLYWNGTQYGTHAFTFGLATLPGEVRGGLNVTFVENVVSGTVTSGGVPVAGATVGFYRRVDDPSPAATVTTAADGTWTARWLRPDAYNVRVTPPDGSGLAPAWWGNTAPNVYGTLGFSGSTARTLSGIDVALTAESVLTGRLVDAAGRPVAGQQVSLWTGQSRPFVVAQATTATDGTYVFGGLDARSYTVQVDPEEGSRDEAWIVTEFLGGALEPGDAVWAPVGVEDDVTVADLVVRLGGTVEGDVVGDPGWDAAGLPVEFLDEGGDVVARMLAQDNVTRPDFWSAALPAGTYRVRAERPGDGYWWVGGTSFATARVLDVRPRWTTEVELVLSDEFLGVPPAPTEPLTEANRGGLSAAGPVAAGATATLVGLEGAVREYVWLAPSFQGLGFVSAAADGSLPVTVPAGTAPGAYRLVVTTAGGYVLGWADLTVTAATGGSGAAPANAAAAVPGAVTSAPTPAAARASRGAGQRAGVLAATGFDGAWLAGSALAAVLLGAGLVVLRRRRSA